jgi:hypothetical protein
MKYIQIIIIFLTSLTFNSCSSNPEKKENKDQQKSETAVAVKENFPTGQIIDKILCKSDTTQSYALYLPKSYDLKKEYPIIYAFDPHATGKLPVSNYKDLAEKYGYIIVGSNNSQNGLQWEQSQVIAARLFNDTKSRLAINTSRVYVMGFSGGARVANALTLSDNSISGVICCGASSPAINPQIERSGYTFFGIAGNADFNYIEMKRYNIVDLAGKNVKHALITFDGKHEWPQSTVMDEAFLWLELNNMRKNNGAKNDTLINAKLKVETEKLNALLKQNKEFEAYELSAKVINYYESLSDLNFFFDTYKKLKSNPEIDKQLRAEEKSLEEENKLQQQYINNLQTNDINWWVKDIAAINQSIKNGKDKKETLVKKRLLSYLSLVCYMQTSGALKQNNIRAAEHFGKLYILVDPTNNEAYYMAAEINAKQAKNTEALKALEQAIKNGFEDKKRLENDSAFVALKENQEFKKIVEIMK